MSILRYLLVKAGLSEGRRDGRFPVRGLVAFFGTDRDQKWAKVKDISATGIYLLSKDRLPPGTAVQLILQKRSLLERDAQPRVQLRAWCVRVDEDGMGLTFVNEPANAGAWSKSMGMAGKLLDASHPVKLFRATKAFAFLMRICPDAETKILPLLSEVNSERVECMIEIALQAEALLASRGAEPSPEVAPALILRVLEYGSKVNDEQLLPNWAGLLVSFCLQKGQEDAAIRFMALVSKLDRDHMAVLAVACARAALTGWQPGFVFSPPLHCPAEEISTITGIPNLTAVERDLNYLHQLGLLEKTAKPLGCAQLDLVNITPTALGLKLYFKCRGYADVPEAKVTSRLEMAS